VSHVIREITFEKKRRTNNRVEVAKKGKSPYVNLPEALIPGNSPIHTAQPLITKTLHAASTSASASTATLKHVSTFFTPHAASQSPYCPTRMIKKVVMNYVRGKGLEEKTGRSSGQRPRPAFIAEILAHPVYSLASRINAQ
jgi:hypothetical protein